MNIKQRITKELIAEHSKVQSEKIAKNCATNKEELNALMEIIFENKLIISQRASWVMSFVYRIDKKCLLPYLEQLIDNLSKKNLHDAVKRNTLKLFEEINPPKIYETKLLDLAIHFLRSKHEAIAIRVFSMTIMVNISLIYPELNNEIKTIILEQYDEESPAYVSRAKKELKRINNAKI